MDCTNYIAFLHWLVFSRFVFIITTLVTESDVSIFARQDTVTCMYGARPNISEQVVRVRLGTAILVRDDNVLERLRIPTLNQRVSDCIPLNDSFVDSRAKPIIICLNAKQHTAS